MDSDAASGVAPLPAFTIRGLFKPPEDSDVPTEINDQNRQSLFKMRKSSYDELVANYPQSVLKYHDSDDGESITVSSEDIIFLFRLVSKRIF